MNNSDHYSEEEINTPVENLWCWYNKYVPVFHILGDEQNGTQEPEEEGNSEYRLTVTCMTVDSKMQWYPGLQSSF